jgi:hypothetical protein
MNTSHELNHLPLLGDAIDILTYIKLDNRPIMDTINFRDGEGKIIREGDGLNSQPLFPLYVAGYNFQEIRNNPTFLSFIDKSQDKCKKNQILVNTSGALVSFQTIINQRPKLQALIEISGNEPFDPTLNTRNTRIELQDTFIAYSSFYLAIMACLVLFNNRNNKIIDNNQTILNGMSD